MSSSDSNKLLSVKETYKGKTLFIAGASGFLGKVFLTLLLEKLPEIERIYILMRKRRLRSPRERFEQMINRSFVFHNLHERYGKNLVDYLSSKIVMLEGDVSLPGLGLAPEVAQRLHGEVDLFVNTAGLVDFNPELREAISVNVDGTLHCAEFVKKCKRAKLLHVSTCFVSGQKSGTISEEVVLDRTPFGKPFDANKEYAEVSALIEKRRQEIDLLSRSESQDALEKKRELREQMIQEGVDRSHALGWTNTYTYSKALSEQLLKLNYASMPFAILRPSIVESSLSFPFPGWNEGFNTCGPLTHLLGTWLRYFPAKVGNPFDVIPVDQVANAMVLVGMELMLGTQKEVYQCSSSHMNMVTIDQAVDLTVKSHQTFYKRSGRGFWQRVVRPWWNVKYIERSWHPLSESKIKVYCGILKTVFATLRLKSLEATFAKYERKWGQIENLMDIFQPFIHDHHQIYLTDHLRRIQVQEKDLEFNPNSWQWPTYWVDVHMPGLRRWCFPMIRREQVQSLEPLHPFYWPTAEEPMQSAGKVSAG